MSELTEEQQLIVDKAYEIYSSTGSDKPTLLISAIAGAGKTHVLTSISKRILGGSITDSGRYLAYNRRIATEARQKFPTQIECQTIHSMAHDHIVKPGNYHKRQGITDLSVNHIQSEPKLKKVVRDIIKAYCLSKYTSPREYIKNSNLKRRYKNRYADKIVLAIQDTFDEILTGAIPMPHDFYLKEFHVRLANGFIVFDEEDIIMLDEFGDVNQVILEIFKLMPAKLKVAAGDSKQNIYQFNDTINGFLELKDNSVTLPMTKSFRVAKNIAQNIEHFCKYTMDRDFIFTGSDVTLPDKPTSAYITRTNMGLIDRMIEMNNYDDPYILSRDPKDMFKFINLLQSLVSGSKIIGLHNREYFMMNGFIELYNYEIENIPEKSGDSDLNFGYDNALDLFFHFDRYIEEKRIRPGFDTLRLAAVFSNCQLLYAKVELQDNVSIARRIIAKYGWRALRTARQEAIIHYNDKKSTYYLTTSHSCKG